MSFNGDASSSNNVMHVFAEGAVACFEFTILGRKGADATPQKAICKNSNLWHLVSEVLIQNSYLILINAEELFRSANTSGVDISIGA